MPDPIRPVRPNSPVADTSGPTDAAPNAGTTARAESSANWTGTPRRGQPNSENKPLLSGLPVPTAGNAAVPVRQDLGFFGNFLRAIAELFAGLFHSLFGTTPNYAQKMELLGEQIAKEQASTLACLRVWTERLGLRDELRTRLSEAITDAVARAQRDGGEPVSPARAKELAERALRTFWAVFEGQANAPTAGHVDQLATKLGAPWPERVAAARAAADAGSARDTDDVLLYLMTAELNGLARTPNGVEGFLGAMRQGLIAPVDVVRTISASSDVPAAQWTTMLNGAAQVPEVGRPYAYALLAQGSERWARSAAELDTAVSQMRRLSGQVRTLGSADAVAEAFAEGWLGVDPNAPLLSTLRRDSTGRVHGDANQEGVLFLGLGDDSGHEAERLRRVAPEKILFVGNPTNKILSSNLGLPALLGEGKVRIRVRTGGSAILRDFDLTQEADQRAFVTALGLGGRRAEELLALLTIPKSDWEWAGRSAKDSRDEIGLIAAAFAEAERGARTIERVVLSSHSGGGSYWGDHNGTIYFDTIAKLAKIFPGAARQAEDFFVAACYNGGASSMRKFVEAFPNLKTITAYQGSAPGSFTSAVAHQIAWEGATRGPFTGGQPLIAARENLQADLPPEQRPGTRYYKSDHIAIWTADTGFTPKGRAAEVLRQEYAAGEATFHDHFAGAVPINPQQGPLRNYYNVVQSMLASEDVIGDERRTLEGRRDATVRLLFYDVRVRSHFVEAYGEILRAAYATVGRPYPDFAALSRAEATAEVQAFSRAVGGNADSQTQQARTLLRDGLLGLSADLIPIGWL